MRGSEGRRRQEAGARARPHLNAGPPTSFRPAGRAPSAAPLPRMRGRRRRGYGERRGSCPAVRALPGRGRGAPGDTPRSRDWGSAAARPGPARPIARGDAAVPRGAARAPPSPQAAGAPGTRGGPRKHRAGRAAAAGAPGCFPRAAGPPPSAVRSRGGRRGRPQQSRPEPWARAGAPAVLCARCPHRFPNKPVPSALPAHIGGLSRSPERLSNPNGPNTRIHEIIIFIELAENDWPSPEAS